MKCDKCTHAEHCPAKAEYGGAIRCSGYKPKMTNEEWFCSLSTEEKAKRIINIAVNSDCDYRTIVEWLKEKHE